MKQSELLRKQADMMDMAEKYGVCRWQTLVQYRSAVKVDEWKTTIICSTLEIPLATELEYRFALGVVEGKPVFEGDVLYDNFGVEIASSAWTYSCFKGLSWTKPKQKTVMVELLREDVEHWAGYLIYQSNIHAESVRLYKACHKALEESCTQQK